MGKSSDNDNLILKAECECGLTEEQIEAALKSSLQNWEKKSCSSCKNRILLIPPEAILSINMIRKSLKMASTFWTMEKKSII
ncbi:MAG: hypothetical protein Q7J78_01235 [Clostridiales bacterium]|nr:hypothetical protein [Clostridiales bacterium]